MKRFLAVLLVATTKLLSNQLHSQCTEIVQPIFHTVTDGSNPCMRTETFDHIPYSNDLQIPGLNTGLFQLRVINRENRTRSREKIIVTDK
jgi:hypothetical protein